MEAIAAAEASAAFTCFVCWTGWGLTTAGSGTVACSAGLAVAAVSAAVGTGSGLGHSRIADFGSDVLFRFRFPL